MGIKPIPTSKWVKFLKSQGLVYIRTKASHDIYDRLDKPLLRPVTVVPKHKEVPRTHIHTSLENIGISKEAFEKLIKDI